MPIKIKDHDKCKEWERRRRDRLNDAFKTLAELLPHYDPARIPAKIDILEKSTEFVKELRLSNSRLLSNQAETDEKCKLIKELQDEVNKLILRVKQLTVLLKKANITIPTGPDIKSLGARRLKWSGKIRPEDVENSVITGEKAGIVQTDKTSPEKDKAAETSVPVSVASSAPSSGGIKTNAGPASVSVASIIIPLKETSNCVKSTVKTSASVVLTSSSCSTTPMLTVSSVQSSPVKLVNSCQPIFTTAPLQLPLQTFIITPCQPLAGSTSGSSQTTALNGQNAQIITRLLPAPILPKGFDPLMQKVPIKSLLKPIPKVIKRRRRRKKDVPALDKDSGKEACSAKPATSEPISDPQTVVENGEKPVEKEAEASGTATKEPLERTETNELTKDTKKCSESMEELENVAEKTEDTDNETVKIPEIVEMEVDDEMGIVEAFSEVAESKKSVESSKTAPEVNVIPERSQPSPVPSVQRVEESKETSDSSNVEPLPDNIPVLRIIEAGSKSDRIETDNILETIIVENVDSSKKLDSGKTNVPGISTSKVAVVESQRAEEEGLPVEQEAIRETDTDMEITVSVSVFNETRCAKDQNTKKNETIYSIPNVPIKAVEKTSEALVESVPEPVPTQTNIESNTEQTLEKVIPPAVSKLLGAPSAPVCPPVLVDPVPEQSTHPPVLSDPVPEQSAHPPVSLSIQDLISHNPQPLTTANKTLHDIENIPESPSDPEPPVPLQEVQETGATLPVSEIPPVLMSLDKIPDEPPTTSKNAKDCEKSRDPLPVTTTQSSTTTDKISECIVRSMDLIDAHDSELMELGDHWEDAGGSPKSISPTQLFLNMFPLLPKESSTSEQPIQPSTSSTVKTSTSQPFLPVSTSSRSSFFIDAMLPDDHSTSVNDNPDPTLSSAASHSPFMPLTPPQYHSSQQISSPFSLSNSYYWTPPLASSSSNTGYSISDPLAFDFRPTTSTLGTVSETVSTTAKLAISTVATASVPSTTSTSSSTSTKTCSGGSTTPRSAKRSKTASAASTYAGPAKLNLSFDNTFTATSTKPAVVSTAQSLSVTTTSITWTAAAPAASHSTAFQQSLSVPQTTGIHLSATSSSVVSSSSQITHQHSCSLFDSLNPMDAAFFRPLMNALDAHDFRGLEFPPSTALPPPPPTLPTLIPPPPPKTLFSTFSHAKTPSSGVSLHDAGLGQFLPHQTPAIFGSDNLQSFMPSSPQVHSSKVSKTSKNLPVPSSSQSQHLSPTKSQAMRVDTTSKSSTYDEKTSRSTGRQKVESKKAKSAKASRVQPYPLPQMQSSTVTPAPAPAPTPTKEKGEGRKQQSYSFHTIQSQIASSNHPPTSAAMVSSAVYPTRIPDFSLEKGSSSTALPFQMSPKVAERQSDQKTKLQASAKHTKSSRSTAATSSSKQTGPPAIFNAKAAPSSGTHNVSFQYQGLPKATVAAASSSSTTSAKTTSNQLTKAVPPNKTAEVPLNCPQTFQQPNAEPAFQLFPEFTQSSHPIGHLNSAATHSQYQHYPQVEPQIQSSQDQGNFHLHRSHPYYFSEMAPTYENINVPIHHYPPSQSHDRQNLTGQVATATSDTSSRGQSHAQQSIETTTPKYAYNQTSYPHQQTQVPHRNEAQVQPQRTQAQPNFSHTPGMLRSNAQQVSSQLNPPAVAVSQGNQMHYPNQQSTQLKTHIPSHSSIAVTSTSTSVSGKGKNQSHPSQTHPLPFQTHHTPQHPVQQPSNPHHPGQSQTSQTAHTHQPQLQQRSQIPSQNIAVHSQHPHPPSSRPALSRTVNWMTDTGYRGTGPSTPAKQQAVQSTSHVSTNNPFSVSKLVGTSSSSGKQQPQMPPGNAGQSPRHAPRTIQPPQHPPETQQQGPHHSTQPSATTSHPSSKTTKSSRNSSAAASAAKATPSRQSSSQGQSNYCAEALIRKNPQPHSTSDWGNTHFNMGASSSHTGQHGSGYQQQPQPHVQHHPHQHHSNPSENFSYTNLPTSGSSYTYPSSSVHQQPSNVSHFTHFDQPHYHTPQQPHSHHQTVNQPGSYNPPTSSSNQQHHQPGPSHLQHYPNQQNHPHQHYHPHGSTSSVSNFNLSTIFPEINDKRSNTSSGIGGGPPRPPDGSNNLGGANNNANNNSGCNFHPNFSSRGHSSGH